MKRFKKIGCVVFVFFLFAFLGCGEKKDLATGEISEEPAVQEDSGQEEEKEAESEESRQDVMAEPTVEEVDWSGYFEGLHGAAVVYRPSENRYQIYGGEQAQTRRSPCSTFKIISSAIALENGILIPENSVRPWSGEIFWNEEWNRDIGFQDAFRSSCVWFFREIVDEIGTELMQKELNRLAYGNCDISDWEGRQNTNNDNRALTGFWIESSLLISPKEQVEVLERIFGSDSLYSQETQEQLKEVMKVSDCEIAGNPVYGKTGLGMAQGVTVDAWFTGFMDIDSERTYFCVYLGETDGADVSSTRAREIALRILSSL